METDRLHQLTVIAKSGSLTQAASILSMTPGALSKSMKALAEQVGFDLWLSAGRGLQLTENALELVARSQSILKEVHDLKNVAQKNKTQDSELKVRIGSFEVFSGKLAPKFIELAPVDAQFEFHELLPGEIEDALVQKKIDVGITYLPLARADVKYQKIMRLEMGVFGREKFQKTLFSELPFLVPLASVQKSSRSKGLDGWDDWKYPRKIRYKVDLLDTGIQLASAGKAVLFLPSFLVSIHNDQVRSSACLNKIKCPIPKSMGHQDVFLISRPEDHDSKICRLISKTLRLNCR